VHINVSEREWMTKRYPLGGAFSGGDAGDAGNFERIAFGILEFVDGGQDARRHFDEGMGGGGAMGDGLCGNVHHAGFAAFVVVREFGVSFGHWRPKSRAKARHYETLRKR